jgi:hypothetical protein
MNRESLAAFRQTLTVTVPAQNAALARRMMAETAERERARVIAAQTARGGVAPTTATVVDGRRGADFESVRPDGTILIEFGYVREVATRCYEALAQAAPRDEGHWLVGLKVLVDGVEREEGQPIPHMARDVKLVATVPYARRLEIGKTSFGDPFVLDDEDYRLVERTARRMAKFYAEVAQVTFAYIDLRGAHQLTNAGARAGKGGGQVRYPAIVITGWQVS